MVVMSGRPKRCALVLLLGLGLAACSSAAQRAQNYYENGQKLVAAHDDTRAALEFKNAIQLKKDMLPAWRALADIDERHHNFTELVPVLRSIVDLDPKDVDTKLKLARLMLFGKAPDEALKLVNSIDQTTKLNADALALKAGIFYQLKDQDGAQREAQAALKINPKVSTP